MSTEPESLITGPKPGLRAWKKGQSGNPHGRRAEGLATAERLRNALVNELPAILEVVVKNAKAGDLNAGRTILERVLAPLKAIEVPAYLTDVSGTLSEQGQGVLQSMAQGLLTPPPWTEERTEATEASILFNCPAHGIQRAKGAVIIQALPGDLALYVEAKPVDPGSGTES